MRFVVICLLALAAGLVGGRRCAPTLPVPEPVVVTRTVISQGKPDTIIKVVERLVMPERQPVVSQKAPEAAAEKVEAFVQAARDTSEDVTLPVVSPRLIDGIRYDGSRLTLWMVGADRAAYREEYRVKPTFTVAVEGGKVTVQSQRFRFSPVIKGVLLVGAGYAAGKAF